MKKQRYYLLIIGGIVLAALGLFMIKTAEDPTGFMTALPYVCIGVGCGIFGHGMGNIAADKAVENSPELQKQIEIDKKDERNIMISNSAKAKAYDLMTYVFGALLLAFALMGVDMIPVLLLVSAYLFVLVYGVCCRIKYEKEM